MRERPILFSSPMVRALLAGTKTQTRRALSPQPPDTTHQVSTWHHPDARPHFYAWTDNGEGCAEIADDAWCKPCPYGQPGDRLWVRETWRVCGGREYEYQQDRSQVMYRATHQEDGFPLTWESYVWRPSIFMPRWASRITLEVTGVRVERLQDISIADAMAEGVVETNANLRGLEPCMEWRYAYEDLWRQINGPDSWDANPWVWVIEFRRT